MTDPDSHICDLAAAHRECRQAREAILRMKALLGPGRDASGLLSALTLLQDADDDLVQECGRLVLARGALVTEPT